MGLRDEGVEGRGAGWRKKKEVGGVKGSIDSGGGGDICFCFRILRYSVCFRNKHLHVLYIFLEIILSDDFSII